MTQALASRSLTGTQATVIVKCRFAMVEYLKVGMRLDAMFKDDGDLVS